jgi:hypothetical protein
MPERGYEQRGSVAAQFRRVGGGDWFESNGLTDPRGPLWRECLGCHRLRTIERMTNTAPDGGGGASWRCKHCGWSGRAEAIYQYQTSLLLDLVETPDCPPIVRDTLARCGQLLYRISRGHAVASAEAGNAARHAVRVLDHYGPWDAWFYRVG